MRIEDILKTIDNALEGNSIATPEYDDIIPRAAPSDEHVILPSRVTDIEDSELGEHIHDILASLGYDSVYLLLKRCSNTNNMVRSPDLDALGRMIWYAVAEMIERNNSVTTIIREPCPAGIVIPVDHYFNFWPDPVDDLQPFRTRRLRLKSAYGQFTLFRTHLSIMPDDDIVRFIAYEIVHQACGDVDHFYVCDRSLRAGVEQCDEGFTMYWRLVVYN